MYMDTFIVRVQKGRWARFELGREDSMQVAPQVHMLDSTKGSYVYLLLDANEPMLIDTGNRGRADRIEAELAALGVRVADIAHILLTHSDVDHIGNAKALAERSHATLWAPKDDVPYIHGVEKQKGVRRLIAAMMRVDRPTIDATYEPGQRIGQVEMIPTPGHTPGHVSFRYGDILFAGDLVMSRGGRLQAAPGILTQDKTKLAKSLRDVGQLTFDWVCPAHGQPIRRGNLWEALVND